MKYRNLALIILCLVGLISCESPEEEAKRLAVEELTSLNIFASQYDEQLVAAAEKGSVKRLQLLLTAGADANAVDGEGNSALFYAIRSKNPDAVFLLVENGANIHMTDHLGESSLMCAVRCSQPQLVQFLMEKGVDVLAASSSGDTALHLAVECGNVAFAESLLKAGAKPLSENKAGVAPFFAAVQSANKEMISLFLNNGCSFTQQDIQGNNALFYAASAGNVSLLSEILASGVDVNLQNKTGQTVLHRAVDAGDQIMVKLLLSAGADLQKCDSQGHNSLYRAVVAGNVEIVKILIEAGADIREKVDALPMLAHAVKANHLSIVELLIQKGADPTDCFEVNRKSTGILSYAGSKSMRNLLKQHGCIELISTDEAIELLVKYEVIDEYAEGKIINSTRYIEDYGFMTVPSGCDDSLRKKAKEILYNYQLYKDGQKKLSDYNYVAAIYWCWNKGGCKKHLPKECIMAFIVHGASLTYALDWAATFGHADILAALISAGAPISQSATDHPLYSAASRGHVRCVELLLKYGVRVDKIFDSYETKTALQIAAKNGYSECVKLLVNAGADVYLVNGYGKNSLDLCSDSESRQYIQAKMNEQNDIFAAAAQGDIETLKKYIAAKGNINAVDSEGKSFLFHALLNKQYEWAQYLLECGADINKVDNSGNTVLYIAAEKGDIEGVRFIIKSGADVNKVHGKKRDTPVYSATWNKHDKCVNLLIESKADLNIGPSHLLIAESNGNRELVKTMIIAGADVDERCYDHQTLLYHYAELGDEEIVKLLIEAGADVNYSCRPGGAVGEISVLGAAAAKNHVECVKLLIAAGANLNENSPLYYAAVNGSTECAKLLIDAGANVNCYDTFGLGFSAIDEAARYGHEETLKLFIKAGASVEAGRKPGPLYFAVLEGHVSCVKLLIAAGADVNERFNCDTILHVAASKGHAECVKLLIKAKAEVNALDNHDDTPYAKAVEGGHKSCIKILEASGGKIHLY